MDELKAETRKGQSEAYSAGFLDYLRNFLVGDSDYDQATHFAPSTSTYMLKFKNDNSQPIKEAKEELQKNISTELELEKAGKEEEGENRGATSPSNTAAT